MAVIKVNGKDGYVNLTGKDIKMKTDLDSRTIKDYIDQETSQLVKIEEIENLAIIDTLITKDDFIFVEATMVSEGWMHMELNDLFRQSVFVDGLTADDLVIVDGQDDDDRFAIKEYQLTARHVENIGEIVIVSRSEPTVDVKLKITIIKKN